ncbi:MAG: hypothetical protein ABIG40_02435 [Parcubacteria group bacterium]
MPYSIEPVWFVGTNAFGRTFAESSGVNLKNIEKDSLEETLRLMPSLDAFYLKAELPVSFEAKVLRNLEPGREIVRLINNGTYIDLFRDVDGLPGDIGVSCDPDGDEVVVATLNIKFREHDDDFTDRGVVWVYPGNPANMGFCIKAKALKTAGAVAEIVTAAEETLKQKVLVHFHS